MVNVAKEVTQCFSLLKLVQKLIKLHKPELFVTQGNKDKRDMSEVDLVNGIKILQSDSVT